MEKVKEKNNKLIIILMLLVFLFVCVFTTLSYFKYTYESEPIIITSTNLSLSAITDNLRDNTDINPTVWSNNMEENEENLNIAKVDLKINSSSGVNGVYTVKLKSEINKNKLYDGGEVTDIKYKVYKSNKLVSEGHFDDKTNVKIIDGVINANVDLADEYKIYVYIEETGKVQDSLKDINFNFNFLTEANQIEE